MSNSQLVTKAIPAYTGNFTKNRAAQGGKISEITIHHCAGNMTIESLGALWQKVGRAGSSHYGVQGSKIGQYVNEEDVAWCNGGAKSPNGWEANCRAVTIETANNGGAPNWPVADSTLQTLIKLVADIAKRNKLGSLTVGKNLTYHSMYAATACPGPYLKSKLQYIANEANKINSAQSKPQLWLTTVGPVSRGDRLECEALAKEIQVACTINAKGCNAGLCRCIIGPVSKGDLARVQALAVKQIVACIVREV